MRFRPGRPSRRPGALRRGPALGGPPRALARGLRQRLAQAHRLADTGEMAMAATAFADLAHAAEDLGMAQRAAHLHLEAGCCLALSGQGAQVLAHARAALALFTAAGLPRRAVLALSRFLEDLDRRGLRAEADALRREAGARLGGPPTPGAAPASQPTRGRLPGRCPTCGGPVRSDEADWIDEHSAECLYCGGTLLTA